MNWREMPFVRLIIPFVIGILFAIYGQNLPMQFVHFALCIATLSLVLLSFVKIPFRWRWLFGIPLSILLFSIGYATCFYKNELNNPQHFQNGQLPVNDTYIIGVVTDKIEKPNHHRLIIAVKKIGTAPDSLQNVEGNFLIYIKKDTTETKQPSTIQYGDLITAYTKLRAIEPPKNPDAIDFQQYWHFQNIHYQSFIDSDAIQVLAHNQGNPIIAQALRWQSHFISILNQHLGNSEEWIVGSALLLGSKEALSDDLRNAYIQSGAMHILAISGMHILLIFGMLEKILALYKSGNRKWKATKTVLLIVLIALFTLLVGMGTSVLRAAVMASFAAIGKAMTRRVSIYNLLAASAFALLLIDPYWLMDIGFQLSYAAVVGIAYFTEKFTKLWVSDNKMLNWAWRNISLGLAAQLMVTPLALYYFHQFPTWFWLTGLAVGIVADFALMTGVCLLIVSKIPIVNWLIGKILFGFLWLMNQMVFTIQKLPFSIIDGFWLSLSTVILIYIALWSFVKAVESRNLRQLYTPLSISVLLCAFYAFSEIEKPKKRSIIVYHIPQNSLVDVIDGGTCYTFFKKFSKNFNLENKIKFAAQNHRNALRINNLVTSDFNEYVKNDNFIYLKRCMVLDSVTVILLDKVPPMNIPLHSDYVIMQESPKVNMKDLTQIFAFKQVIFDSSNKRKQVEKWKQECKELNLNYYDIAEKGAWVYNF